MINYSKVKRLPPKRIDPRVAVLKNDWSKQIARRSPEPWRFRRLVKYRPELRLRRRRRRQRRPPPRSMANRIYREIYLPRLIRFERRIRGMTFEKFQLLPPADRRRLLELFNFSLRYQHLLERLPGRFRRLRRGVFASAGVVGVRFKLPTLDFDRFSEGFVRGGLVMYKPLRAYQPGPYGRPFYHGGTPDLDEEKIRRLKEVGRKRPSRRQRLFIRPSKVKKLFTRYQRKNRRKYFPNLLRRLNRGVVKKKRLKIHQIRPAPSAINKIRRYYERGWFQLSRVEGWFTTTEARRVNRRMFLRFKNFFRSPKPAKIAPRPDSPRPRLKFRPLDREEYDYQLWHYHDAGYRSRWQHVQKPVREIDPVQTRWDWSTRYRGGFASRRSQFIHEDLNLGLNYVQQLNLRFKVLTRQLYYLRVTTYRADCQVRHQQLITLRLPKAKKIRLDRRRFFQRRLLRLRRTMEFTQPAERYYLGVTNKTYAAYQPNRFSRMELNNIVRRIPFIRHILDEEVRREETPVQFFFPMYYNFFKRDSLNLLMRRWRVDFRRRRLTKSGQTRMKPQIDHPIWGKIFKDYRQRRLDYTRRTLVSKYSDRKTLKSYTEVPFRDGFQASMYAQKVDTRRKLDGLPVEDRSLMSFARAFLGGFTVEKRQKKTFPATIGALSSFNRASLNLEAELATGDPRAAERYRHLVGGVAELKSRLRPVQPPGLLRWVAYYLWFYLFTPVWTVYYWVAKFYSYALRGLVWFWGDFWFEYRNWLRLYLAVVKLMVVNPFNGIQNFLRQTRFVRLMTWVYTSWLYVDILENYQREQDLATFAEEDEARIDGDIDPEDERAQPEDEPDDTSVGFDQNDHIFGLKVFYHGNPAWEWYIHHVPSEELYDLAEEASYLVRFIVRPFVDFIVFLPIWSFLELASLWLEVIKMEYHRMWLKIILYGNRPGRIRGRWWKIPLVLVKNSIRLTIWMGFTFWMVDLIKSEDLKILITYNLGYHWFEEYYYLYVAICLVASTYLLGPIPVRDFFFKELGFENLAYIFTVPASISRPESYQPQRPAWKTQQHFTRFELQFGEKEEAIGEDPINGRIFSEFPNDIVSFDDIRAVLAQFTEFEHTPSMVHENNQECIDRMDPLVASEYMFNLSERHPSYLRNEWLREPRYRWEAQNNVFVLVSELDWKKYTAPHSAEQYWNRTIIHRQELPQSINAAYRPPRRY